MHPYREAPLRPAELPHPEPPPRASGVRLAFGVLLAWALVRGAVAAYDGSRSADVWLAVAVVLVVIPAAARRRRT
jgi:hypothetical protein